MERYRRHTITAPRSIDRGRLRRAIEDAFTELALHPECDFHFISGPPLAERLGYDLTGVPLLPERAIASFSGVGNPFRMGWPAMGSTVLDLGCGSGTDTLLAARAVGPSGRVIGVDMTAAMVERAHQNVLAAGATNVRIEWGYAESIPLPDRCIDCVISNGVITLTPDKRDTFREIARVLKPDGRLQIADVLVDDPVPEGSRGQLHLWTECVAGATPAREYLMLLDELGFRNAAIHHRYDVFNDTRIECNARSVGAHGAAVGALAPRRTRKGRRAA